MLYNLDLTLVTVLVISVWAALLCLLAIWAGLAQWPAWYWRVGAMCAAVGILFPIEAYEPAMMFLAVMPLTALGAYVTCGRPRTNANDTNESQARPGRWRFSLGDLMLTMLFSGLASAMIAVLWQKQDSSGLVALAGLAAGLSAVAVFSAALVVSRHRRWLYGLALVASLGALVAGHSYFTPNVLGLNHVIFLQTLANIILHCLVAYVVFSLLLVTALLLAPLAFGDRAKETSTRRRGRRIAARGILVVGGIVLAAPLLAVYWWMLEKAPIPENNYPAENSLPRVLALIDEAHRLNVSETAVVETGEAADPERAAKLASLYKEMESALAEEGYVELEFSKTASATFLLPPETPLVRGQGRAWCAEAEWAASEGRFDDASTYCIATARLGNAYSRGGILIHCLVGLAVQEMGTSKLAEMRGDVSPDRALELISQLQRIDRSREDPDLTHARDAAWVDRTLVWRYRLALAVTKLLGRRHVEPGTTAARSAINRRDATLRLLMTELAIRLYRDEHGQLPQSLADLVPEFLSAPPLDPYSGRPLVYKRTAEGYLLYSVWQDGVDDGGTFPTSSTQYNATGFDFDIDFFARWTAAGS